MKREAISEMETGHLSIVLGEEVPAASFPWFAKDAAALLGGKVMSRSDGEDVSIWEVVIEGISFDLVYENPPGIVSLESFSTKGDALIRRIPEMARGKDEE